MSVSIYAFAEEVALSAANIFSQRSSEKRYRVVIPAGTPRYALTSLISRAKLKDEKISTLHLIAHGGPGKLALSGVKFREQVLDVGACSWFGALKIQCEKAFPRIIVHGCQVASDLGHDPKSGVGVYHGNQTGVGYNFLLALAQATNTIVEAGIHVQGNDSRCQLEGSRITVGPNGAVPGAEFQYAPFREAL